MPPSVAGERIRTVRDFMRQLALCLNCVRATPTPASLGWVLGQNAAALRQAILPSVLPLFQGLLIP
jgi:hypothetical protein